MSSCPACRSGLSRVASAIRQYEFRRCHACATLFCITEVPADEAAALYRDERYFENPDFGSPETGGYHGYKRYLADREEIHAKFDRVLARVERTVRPGRLLDVGAGPGLLLAAAAARGWEPLGLDLNPWAVRFAAEEVGQDVRLGTLDDAKVPAGSFDAVTMMDLLEHSGKPDELVAEAARITRPGGALAVLTPDAGSPVSRLLGARWPELRRAPEHLTLFSARGLASLLARHGYEPLGWHWIGKRSSVATLAADVAPVAPSLGRLAERSLSEGALGRHQLELDPHTKFSLYARRRGDGSPDAGLRPPPRPPRLPRRSESLRVAPEEAVLDDLRLLAGAERLCDWMFAQYRDAVRGRVAEVGAGIGTFTERILAAGAEHLLAVEPEPQCATAMTERFAADERVEIARDPLPNAPTLAARAGTFDLVVCQNVLEHVGDDQAAVEVMAEALRPGGTLALVVPAHPRLYGRLDERYGHLRRYSREQVVRRLAAAGLDVERAYAFNALGVPGWWLRNLHAGDGLGSGSLEAYERLLSLWRPLEERGKAPFGLSLVARARRPDQSAPPRS